MVDTQQAERVTRIALQLYAGVQPKAGAEARRELLWASALHEIGMMISHHDHHRHSAYVLSHADAAGFSQSQLRRVGELVLGQRGGLRKIEQSLQRDDFAWQVLCLRLGVIKCHARGDVSADVLTLTRDGSTARLRFSNEWSETHPRTRYLLAEEAALWGRGGPLRLELAR
jgi:exopolyphosphatase/guanosine-5'-triphosphate,3'-diphosphate pyrophosphatase